jgi:hypothetical protein
MVTDTRVEQQDLSTGDLSLEARDGESLRILARGVSGADAGTIVEEYVREELLLAYPSDEGDEELAFEETVQHQHRDLFAALDEWGLDTSVVKVPEGQTYTLASTTGSGSATVIYEELGAGQVSGDRPGGPGNKSRTFVSSAEETATLAAGSTETFDVETSVQPAQLDEFPWNEDVPPNREYELQALMLGLSGASGANVSLNTFRLNSDETDFLARDRDFIDVAMAQYPSIDLQVQPMLFLSEPSFTPGSDLDLTVEASNAGSGAEDAVVTCSMVFYRRAR